MAKDWKQRPPGTWFKVKKTGYKMKCCDCNLVHTIDFRIESGSEPYGGEFELRVERDDAMTQIERDKAYEAFTSGKRGTP